MLRISPKYYDPEASGLTSWRIETESIPRPPQVIASSFTQSLPYLHNYPFGILLGVTMMCLLTQVIMPLIRFLLGLPRACRGVSTEFCSPASFSPNLTVSNLAAY